MTHWTGAVVATRMTMALPVLAFPAAMAEASALALVDSNLSKFVMGCL